MLKCPKCGMDGFDVVSADNINWRDESFENWEARNPGRRLRCFECGAVIAGGRKGGGSRYRDRFQALKQATEPRDQFTTYGGKKNTHYGITKKLEDAGYRLPSEFSGSSDQLAKKIGMSHADLAEVWRKSEQDLRQLGLIKITHPPGS